MRAVVARSRQFLTRPVFNRTCTVRMDSFLGTSLLAIGLFGFAVGLASPYADGLVSPNANNIWLSACTAFAGSQVLLVSVGWAMGPCRCSSCYGSSSSSGSPNNRVGTVLRVVFVGSAVLLAFLIAVSLSISASRFGTAATGWPWAWFLVLSLALLLIQVTSPPTESEHSRDPPHLERPQSDHESEDQEPLFQQSPSSSQRSHGRLFACAIGFLLTLNWTGWLVFWVNLVLLSSGAVQSADGVVRFAPRGDFAAIKLADGSLQRILWTCEGPTGASRPTLILDADASHGSADFWPLQRVLSENGWRTCTFDKPGNGWSDYYYVHQQMNTMSFYPQLIDSLSERGPFIFVGWGGGAPIVWEYASAYPENVAAFVFLDVYSNEFEWQSTQYVHNWTADQTREYRAAQLETRFGLFALIRGLAAPWGFMSLFVASDPATYAWPERFSEYQYSFRTQKTWTTQYAALRRDVAIGDGFDFAPARLFTVGAPFATVPAGLEKKPLLQIMSTPPATRRDLCKHIDESSKECDDVVKSNEYSVRDRLLISNITGNGFLYNCTDVDCDLGFPLRFPEVVVAGINAYFDMLVPRSGSA